jgi:hypothetical protein
MGQVKVCLARELHFLDFSNQKGEMVTADLLKGPKASWAPFL